MKTTHDVIIDRNIHVENSKSVGETHGPTEVLLNVDELLKEHGLEVEMLDFDDYYHSFRIIIRE